MSAFSSDAPAPVLPRISSRAREVSDTSSWLTCIRSIQTERCTPEVVERIQATSRRRQEVEAASRRCMRLERGTALASASAMRTMATCSAFSSAPAGWSSAPLASARRVAEDQTRQTGMIQFAFGGGPAMSRATPVTEEEADEALDSLEVELGAGVVAVASSEAGVTEIRSLLQQLVSEPSVDVEIEAKFALFETFHATVVTIREEILKFWTDNEHLFTGGVRSSCEREIAAIDRHEALGIVDDPSKWFVYGMTRKAHDNSLVISGALAKFRSRLQLLSQELEDCPFCLDPISPDICTTLGCCHRVCTPCWQHWVQVKGAHGAFCPLCKHAEFVEEVIGGSV